MLFHTYAYFQLFLIAFTVYWLLGSQRARVAWLLVASIVFYANWNPVLVALVLATAAFSFHVGKRIEDAEQDATRRRWLVAGVSVPLLVLAYFKYTNFLIAQAWRFAPDGASTPFFEIVLPLGISFYTFETLCYVIDIHRRKIRAERSLMDYAVFLLFFPHLIAGPIVRPGHFLPQIKQARRLDWMRIQAGAQLFLLGLFKKAVIADHLALLADPVFADPGRFDTAACWAGALAYTIQIYCDFSGYSDMAIGSAHALGIKLPKNFDMPYLSANPAEFWRRWHISLSSWLRDYLYVPLGGNRHGTMKTYRNLMLTMLLGGLWHGAAWTFVLWGLYHGLLLALHRAIPWPRWMQHAGWHPLRVATTFLCVVVGWVFFRAQNLGDATLLLSHMFRPTGGVALEAPVWTAFAVVMSVVALAHLVGARFDVDRLARRLPAPIAAVGLGLGFLLSQLLTPDEGGAFIYFQF